MTELKIVVSTQSLHRYTLPKISFFFFETKIKSGDEATVVDSF